MRPTRTWILCLSFALASGCFDSSVTPGDASEPIPDAGTDAGPPPPPSGDLDVLVMMDDSTSLGSICREDLGTAMDAVIAQLPLPPPG